MMGRYAAWNAKYEYSPTKETQQEIDMKSATFETVATLAGQEIGVSDWVEVSQDRINRFADATGDHQWIHVDVERAKREMPGGKTIAHGYLTLSLLPRLSHGILHIRKRSRGINYGSNRVRFTAPVPAGARVRLHQTLKNAEDIDGGVRMTFDSQIEVEGSSRPALVAENIGLAFD